MRGMFALLILIAAVSASEGKGVMAAPSLGHCRVVNAGKLARPGEADAICAAVERAILAEAPTVRYNAEISVVSPSRLAATLVVEDRILPVQNFAVMDGNLNDRSIAQFAHALATEIAKSAKP